MVKFTGITRGFAVFSPSAGPAYLTPFEMIFNLQLHRRWIQHGISFPTVYYMSPFEEIQVEFQDLAKISNFQNNKIFKNFKVKV